MKKYKYYILILQLAIIFSACNRDNLYVDPSKPLVVTPQTMLTSIQANTFMHHEGELGRVASVFSQHMAGVDMQYIDFQDYLISEVSFDNNWEGLYTSCMYNCHLLATEYSDKSPSYLGLSKIMMAMNLGIATDLWGDVPYSDAFKAKDDQFSSRYDSQENVLKSIQQLLSEGITELKKPEEDNVFMPDSDDLIFNGNIDAWISAAWILKARYANRLSLKDPAGSAADVVIYVNNAKAIALVDMEAPHSSAMMNQWYDFQMDRGSYFRANKYFVDILESKNDPRLPYFFSEFEGGYVGADINETTVTASASTINTKAYFSESNSFVLASQSEAYFLLAEAKSRLNQDASGDLNEAIKTSIKYVTKGANDGSGIVPYTNVTATIDNIMMEKWIAMFGQIEAYNDYRRTGLPALIPRPQSAGAAHPFIPRSFTTPSTERLYNDYAVPHGVDKAVWWAIP